MHGIATMVTGRAEHLCHPDTGTPLAFPELDMAQSIAYVLVLNGHNGAGVVAAPDGAHVVHSEHEAHHMLIQLIEGQHAREARAAGAVNVN